MNRVQGDYFETLLYKIFVSIDEQTNVSEVDTSIYIEVCMHHKLLALVCCMVFWLTISYLCHQLANVLQIDLGLVKVRVFFFFFINFHTMLDTQSVTLARHFHTQFEWMQKKAISPGGAGSAALLRCL